MLLKEATWKIIHLSHASERDDLVKAIEEQVGATCFEAVKGESVKEKYATLNHPLPGQPIRSGLFGCSQSFYEVLKVLETTSTEYVGIFEDDCRFKECNQTIESWISTLPSFDICFLGVTEPVEYSTLNSDTLQVKRFWGAHSILFKRSIIPLLFKTFDSYFEKKTIPIPDWWFSSAIKEYSLTAFCANPCNLFCHQEEGLTSYLTGSIRNNTKHLKEYPKKDK